MAGRMPGRWSRSEGTRLNSSHTVISTLSLHDALPIFSTATLTVRLIPKQSGNLTFYSVVGGGVPEPEDNFPNTALANLIVGPGQGIFEFTTARTNGWENAGAVVEIGRHTSELQSHSDLHSFPTRRSSDLQYGNAHSEADPKAIGQSDVLFRRWRRRP